MVATAVFLAVWLGRGAAQQAPGEPKIDADDIGGVVTSAKGPEGGVWVIAETTDLPTKFVKIVVTDDRGRYVIPDLPNANYSVWTRGYGLVDSPKMGGVSYTSAELVAGSELTDPWGITIELTEGLRKF